MNTDQAESASVVGKPCSWVPAFAGMTALKEGLGVDRMLHYIIHYMPNHDKWIDRAAMSLSGLCLAHCIGGTLLIAVLSSTGGLLFSHQIHAIGLAIALPLATFALWRGVRLHGRWLVAILGAAGLAAMAVALTEPHGARPEILLTVLGVALLGSAHLYNLRLRA